MNTYIWGQSKNTQQYTGATHLINCIFTLTPNIPTTASYRTSMCADIRNEQQDPAIENRVFRTMLLKIRVAAGAPTMPCAWDARPHRKPRRPYRSAPGRRRSGIQPGCPQMNTDKKTVEPQRSQRPQSGSKIFIGQHEGTKRISRCSL